MIHFSLTIIIISLFSLLTPGRHFQRDVTILPDMTVPDPPAQWYSEQFVDHFDFLSNKTWSQKYFSSHTDRQGPIFLYIGGEGPLNANRITVGMIVEMAEIFDSPLYSLEHRYFGDSFPVPNITTPNMAYLSVEQAVWDLNRFIHFINPNLERPVVVFGCSYPGVLSSIMKSKFSFSTLGSIASSAPILAKENFVEYDEMVKSTLPDTCANHIQAATRAVQRAALPNSVPAGNYSLLLDQFSCSTLPNTTKDDVIGFLYVLADVVAFSVQYNHNPSRPYINTMCDDYFDTLGPNPTDEEYVNMYSDYVKSMFGTLDLPCNTWDIGNLTNFDSGPTSSLRSWMYMSCAEFGFWQTGYPGSLRSELITVDWHVRYVCDRNFAKSTPWIDSSDILTNSWTGDISIVGESAATNVHFTNGGSDPWSKLSIRTIDRPIWQQVTANVVEGGSHCLDFGASSPSDPQTLKDARDAIKNSISAWIAKPSFGKTCTGGTWIAGVCYCPEGDRSCHRIHICEPGNNGPVSPVAAGFIGAAVSILAVGAGFIYQHRKKSGYSQIGLSQSSGRSGDSSYNSDF